jgi:hypothetical protein
MTNDELMTKSEVRKAPGRFLVRYSSFAHSFVIASRLPPLTLSGCGHLAPLPAGSIRHSAFVIFL